MAGISPPALIVISKELCDITNNYATNNPISKKKIDPN